MRNSTTPTTVYRRERVQIFLAALAITGILLLSVSFYQNKAEIASLKRDLEMTTNYYQSKVSELQSNLASTTEMSNRLSEDLRLEKGRNDYFAFQLGTIQSTVGTLEKLSKTDEELLAKYSKVYFLNENYVPASLTDLSSSAYALNKDKQVSINSSVWPYLQSLLQTATQSGLDLKVLSGYRSFTEQTAIKTGYKVVYGSGANTFSADQGYSEHQLGTTVDFTNSELGANLNGFKATAEYTWLLENGYKFGFILSYPENNRFYQFEPWHWRFVGVKLATYLHQSNKHFYNLDQREIDSYLISLFD